MDLANKKVTVIGTGRSGLAAARLLLKQNAKVKISDSAKEVQLPDDLHAAVEVEAGGNTRSFIETSDLIVVSPGVAQTSEVFQWAAAKRIPVWGEIELAYRFCRRPIIAVTGSNGKTTVSTLIAEVLRKAGKDVALCGNIGVPFSQEVLNLQKKDFVVLEVSSFQLETVEKFRPFIAVLLNVTQNHLDRHKDFNEYLKMKMRIFMNQLPTDMAFLNMQDPSTKMISSFIKPRTFYFNVPNRSNGHTINPNHSVVYEIAKVLGIAADVCDRVLADFPGVEHRLERVREIDGIKFINDSKATTAEAGQWALSNVPEPILMICGGRDKNIDFSVVSEFVRKKVKKMFVYGEARAKIKKAFGEIVKIEECEDLEGAVKRSRQEAIAGDSVLLSPMCTSFDMYKNYEERGRDFKRIVQDL